MTAIPNTNLMKAALDSARQILEEVGIAAYATHPVIRDISRLLAVKMKEMKLDGKQVAISLVGYGVAMMKELGADEDDALIYSLGAIRHVFVPDLSIDEQINLTNPLAFSKAATGKN